MTGHISSRVLKKSLFSCACSTSQSALLWFYSLQWIWLDVPHIKLWLTSNFAMWQLQIFFTRQSCMPVGLKFFKFFFRVTNSFTTISSDSALHIRTKVDDMKK